MKEKVTLSILVCTYNGEKILPYCLESLRNQTIGPDEFEVLVIDNNSGDQTREVVSRFQEKMPNLHYCKEEQVGLSHARNRGFASVKSDWVLYLDDDAKAGPTFVERALWLISTFNFDCFGGHYVPWYLTPKPKWLSDDFGRMPLLLEKVGPLPGKGYVHGGVIGFRKKVLEEVGGFPSNLGMSGSSVGYGEENWVQKKLRERGYTIGFDPELRVDHLVAEYKFSVGWHLTSQYAKGKSGRVMGNVRGMALVLRACWALLVTIKECIGNSVKLLFNSNYYIQNYVVDSFGYLFVTLGLFGRKDG